jgi:hypothetical protein
MGAFVNCGSAVRELLSSRSPLYACHASVVPDYFRRPPLAQFV